MSLTSRLRSTALTGLVALLVVSGCDCEDPAVVGGPCRVADLQKDAANCGRCGQKCGEGEGCAGGLCVKPDPCEGLDLTANHDHCGTCGNACAAEDTCQDSKCVVPCDGMDLRADDNNCGTCGNQCTDGATCIDSQCTTPLAIAWELPAADAATVPPRFELRLTVTATGPITSLVVTAAGQLPVSLTSADPHGYFLANAGGELELTATLAQDDRTVTAVRKVLVDAALVAPKLTGAGFYLGTEDVKLSATPADGFTPVKIDFAIAGEAQPFASITTADEGGAFSATKPAKELGRGDVRIRVTATDEDGQWGFSEGTVSIAWLHDTDCDGCPSFVRSVKTPTVEGAVHLASIQPAPADGSAPMAGELRFTGFGGGSTSVVAARACTDGVEDHTRIAADGSRVLAATFETPPPPGLVGAVPTCRQLVVNTLPPAAGGPEELTRDYDGEAYISLDGDIWLWAERPAGGGDRVWWVKGPGTAAVALSLNEQPQFIVPMVGAILVSDGALAEETVWVKATGSVPVVLDTFTGGGTEPVVLARDGNTGFVLGADGRTAAAYHLRYNGEVLVPVTLNTARDTAFPLCEYELECGVQDDLFAYALQDGTFLVQFDDFEAGRHSVAWVDADSNDLTVVGEGWLDTRSPRPLDGSSAGVRLVDSDLMSVSASSDETIMIPAAGGSVAAFNWQVLGISRQAPVALWAPWRYGPWELPGPLVASDGSQLVLAQPGAAAVRLDPAAAGYAGAPLLLTPDGTRFLWRTQTDSWSAGQAYVVPVAGGPVVKLSTSAEPDLPVYFSRVDDMRGAALDARSNSLIALVGIDAAAEDAGRLFVARLDGTSMTLVPGAVGSQRPAFDSRMGVDATDKYVWWIDELGHLDVQGLAADSPVVDLGAFEADGLFALPNGVFVGRFSTATDAGWGWASAAHPAPVLLGAAADLLVVADHGRAAYFGADGSFWRLDANGATEVATQCSVDRSDELGVTWSQGDDGRLVLVGLRLGEDDGLDVEGGGAAAEVDEVLVRDGLATATPAGLVEPPWGNDQDFLRTGAQPRGGLSYHVVGGTRPGWYLWTVRDLIRITEVIPR